MLNQIKNARFYLQAKLGQRGAEMVEYAIVLACIAAIGVAYYSIYGTDSASGNGNSNFMDILDSLWLNIKRKVNDEIK